MTTETLTTPIEVVTPIKPSEALRLGRLMRPIRVPGEYLTGESGACAVGAMAVGYGMGALEWTSRFNSQHKDLYSGVLTSLFDAAECAGQDGDAAVLAYLAERGL